MRIQRQREAFAWRLSALGQEAPYSDEAELPEFSLDEEAYAARSGELQRRLKSLREANDGDGMDTRYIHGRVVKEPVKDQNGQPVIGKNGQPQTTSHVFWNRARRQEQIRIENLLYDEWRKNALRERRATIMGGLPGSGKGTIIQTDPSLRNSGYLIVDPDKIKETLAAEGMIPDLIRGASAMEQSSLVHEEASEMAKNIAQRAMKDGYNLLWDITMASPGSVASRVKALRDNGYGEVNAAFVEQTIPRSVAQATRRHQGGESEFRDSNKGNGGRMVPADLAAEAGPKTDSGWESSYGETFDAVKHLFDNHIVYDGRTWDARKDMPVVMRAHGPTWGHRDPGAQQQPQQPQPQPQQPQQQMVASRWFVAEVDPQSSCGIINAYGHGEIDFDTLVQGLSQDWDMKEKLPAGSECPDHWMDVHHRAECHPQDCDTAYWLHYAEREGVLTPDEVDHIHDVLEQIENQGQGF